MPQPSAESSPIHACAQQIVDQNRNRIPDHISSENLLVVLEGIGRKTQGDLAAMRQAMMAKVEAVIVRESLY